MVARLLTLLTALTLAAPVWAAELVTDGGGDLVLDGSGIPTVSGDSYWGTVATAAIDMPLQDNGPTVGVVNRAGTDGSIVGGDQATDLTTTGPGAGFPLAFNFEGSSSYIDLPALPGATDWFVSFWMRAPLHTTPFSKWTDNSNWELEINFAGQNNLIGLSSRSALVVERPASYLLTPNQWFHLAGARSGSNYTLWINGAEHATGSISQPPIESTQARIGADRNGNLSNATLAGFVWRNSSGAASEAAELYAGPEPQALTNGTVTQSGDTIVVDTAPTFDSYSNGSVSQRKIVQHKPSGGSWSVIQDTTGAVSVVPPSDGDVRIITIGSNDGGFSTDSADWATTPTYAYVAPSADNRLDVRLHLTLEVQP